MKARYYLFSILGVLVSVLETNAQTETENYISTFDVQQAGVTNPAELYNGVPVSKAIQTIQYYDGLGRPIQMVQVGVSPIGKDVIKPIEYNNVGLDVINLLPYSDKLADGSYRGDYEAGNQDFYQGIYYDSYGRAPVEYEKSPLQRVLKQGSAGEDWQIDLGNNHHGKFKTFEYIKNDNSNAELTVEMWKVTGAQCELAGTYSNAELYVLKTTDEDNKVVYEFKDKLGQVVLKRMIDGTDRLDTYYVYDDFGLLRFVISPEGSNQLTGTFDIRNAIAQQFVYFYTYDGRKRLIEKKIPGKGWEYYVYNKNDQLILYQDGNLMSQALWLFTKYDALGRVIMTGLKQSERIRTELQALADQNNNSWEYLDSPSSNTANNNYYSNNTYPNLDNSSTTVLLTVNYYDRYTFYKNNNGTVTAQTLHNDNQLNLDIPAPLIEIYNPDQKSVTGMPTVSFTNYSSGYSANDYLTTVNYYDTRGRNIQTRMENHMPGYDFYTNQYQEMTSRVVNSSHIQKVTSGTTTITHTELTQNAYDAYGRITVSDYCFDGISPHQNTSFNYDAAGNMIMKNQGPAATSVYQSIDYTYNIKGWLTAINNPANISDQGDLFGMQLFYNVEDADIGNSAMYNGNISGVKWQNTGALSTMSNPVNGLKAYSFNYDGINRLKFSFYKENIQNVWCNNEKYNELLTYDLNGNIKTLQRKGLRSPNNAIGFIDDLTYTYEGNRLIAVDDSPNDNAEGGFADNGHYYTGNAEYMYDNNGNMKQDINKGVDEITYNYMNLVNTARKGQNEIVEYQYDATGIKLKQIHSNRSTSYLFTTDFVANFVYENGQLAHVNTPEGRMVYNSNGTIRQEFNLKDHLGNVRVVYSVDNGVVTTRQIDNYYPFGYNIKGLSVNKYATTRPNEYLYNGKMMQDEMGLALLDYGARMYDAAIGRWSVVDPLAEKYYSISPFAYVANDPLLFIDPDGMKWGNPDDIQSQNETKKEADEMKEEYRIQRDKWQELYNHLNNEIVNYDRDKTSMEYQQLIEDRKEANVGINQMEQAIREINILENDPNYYYFNPTLVDQIDRPNILAVTKNSGDETYTVKINYAWGSLANKAHEMRHAFDFAMGESTPVFQKGKKWTTLFKQDVNTSESMAYLRQYFFDKNSMPVTVNSYKELTNFATYGERINKKFGKSIY